jgi:hypothetical protein
MTPGWRDSLGVAKQQAADRNVRLSGLQDSTLELNTQKSSDGKTYNP